MSVPGFRHVGFLVDWGVNPAQGWKLDGLEEQPEWGAGPSVDMPQSLESFEVIFAQFR